MLNIDTLDTVIALVVVILLLSLIVQSVQSLIKKLLKLKSKEIEDSLLDLFNAVLRDTSQAPNPNAPSNRPMKKGPAIFAASPAPVSQAATDLLVAVKREMRELGRLTARGNFMADSLSKGDLLNILARVAPNAIGGDFGKLIQAFQQLDTLIDAVKAENLPADVSVLWAKFRGTLVPLKQHFNALTNGTGTVAPGVIVADVLKLRDVVFGDSLDLLEKVQTAVANKNIPGLDDKAIATISANIAAARDALDTSFGAFKSKLTETEQWFDTTMQSFEERYHRGMRTVSLIIAACVVVLLNADVFSLYRNISKNEILRSNLVKAGPDIANLQEKIARDEAALEQSERATTDTTASSTTDTTASSTTDTATSSTTDTATSSTTDTLVSSTETSASDTATTGTETTDTSTTGTVVTKTASGQGGKPAPTKQKSPREQIEDDKKQLEQLVRMYTDFGLEPLSAKGIADWVKGWFTGPCEVWLSRRGDDVRTLFGWILMTLLLSLGAPFWHDALESLFGVKNLLRKRNEQQNVEQAKGAGNPKA